MKKEVFISQFEGFVHEYYAVYKNGTKGWGELKKLTEFQFLLEDALDMCEFDYVDRVNLLRISEKISDMIRFDKIIFYYSSFHYFYNYITHSNYQGLQKIIYQINIQINIMKIQIKHFMVTGCSEDDYFFEDRGSELVSALEILCEKDVQDEVDYNAILYMILNYEQALLQYINSGETQYIESAKGLIERCMNLVKKLCKENSKLQVVLRDNIKLKMFIYSVYNTYLHVINKVTDFDWSSRVLAVESSDNLTNNVWATRNIYDLDINYFETYFEANFKDFETSYNKLYEDSKIVYLRCYLRWLKIKKDNKMPLLKLPAVGEKDDKTWFDINLFINGYNESATIDVFEDEVKLVQGYNDDLLRRKIANILINIDKHTINRECQKPHTGLEIADMEIPIRTAQGETYYMCIPVKSGVEISSKVKEEISYQIIRPFTYFGNKAIVVFISAKEATEAFYNYIKRAKANLNFDIYVIAGVELVKLLKYNKEL